MKLKINNEIITHSSYIVFTKIQPKGAIQLLDNLRKQFEEIRNQIWEKKPHKCVNCGAESNLHLHHIVPLSLGGTNNIDNIVPLCEECHSKVHKLDMKGHSEATKKGIAKAKLNGSQIGQPKGAKLTTKKSLEIKPQILKYSKSFNGSLTDTDTIKLLQIDRKTYYKYKKELKAEAENKL